MSSIRRLIKPLLWHLYKGYLLIPRWYQYDGIKVRILPGVFHPGLLGSTKVLYQFAQSFALHGKSVLELGAGSGLISLMCSRSGAKVFATDINPKCMEAITTSAAVNDLDITVLQGDLFDPIPPIIFDYIFVNPPYYNQEPKTPLEHAFYCGNSYQYFKRMFSQIGNYLNQSSQVFMVLSDTANIQQISKIAHENNFTLKEQELTRKRSEKIIIYQIISG